MSRVRHVALRSAPPIALFAVSALYADVVEAQPQKTPAAEARPSNSRAAELYADARRLHKEQKLDQALAAYLDAWNLEKRFEFAANLGKLELELGHSRDAAEHLSYALVNVPADLDPKARALLEQSAQVARSRVGTVRVELEPPNAELSVDGRAVQPSPLTGEVFVEPGTRSFEARLSGHDAVQRRLDIAAGSSTSIRFELAASKAHPNEAAAPPVVGPAASQGSSASTTPSATPADVDHSGAASKKSMVPVYVGAGVTAVAAGAGIVFLLIANHDASERVAELEPILTTSDPYPCYQPLSRDVDRCADAADKYDHEKTMRGAAVASFIVAGVAGAATLAYFLFWPDASKERVGKFRIVPLSAGQRASGLAVHGSF